MACFFYFCSQGLYLTNRPGGGEERVYENLNRWLRSPQGTRGNLVVVVAPRGNRRQVVRAHAYISEDAYTMQTRFQQSAEHSTLHACTCMPARFRRHGMHPKHGHMPVQHDPCMHALLNFTAAKEQRKPFRSDSPHPVTSPWPCRYCGREQKGHPRGPQAGCFGCHGRRGRRHGAASPGLAS